MFWQPKILLCLLVWIQLMGLLEAWALLQTEIIFYPLNASNHPINKNKVFCILHDNYGVLDKTVCTAKMGSSSTTTLVLGIFLDISVPTRLPTHCASISARQCWLGACWLLTKRLTGTDWLLHALIDRSHPNPRKLMASSIPGHYALLPKRKYSTSTFPGSQFNHSGHVEPQFTMFDTLPLEWGHIRAESSAVI